MNEKFKNYLLKENLSEKTITSYLWTIKYFITTYWSYRPDTYQFGIHVGK